MRTCKNVTEYGGGVVGSGCSGARGKWKHFAAIEDVVWTARMSHLQFFQQKFIHVSRVGFFFANTSLVWVLIENLLAYIPGSAPILNLHAYTTHALQFDSVPNGIYAVDRGPLRNNAVLEFSNSIIII